MEFKIFLNNLILLINHFNKAMTLDCKTCLNSKKNDKMSSSKSNAPSKSLTANAELH